MEKSWIIVLGFVVLCIGCSCQENHARSVHDYPQVLPICGSTIKTNDEANVNNNNNVNNISDRPLVLISTLDGKVTALDFRNGHLKWSVVTGPGSMMSSTISQIEVNSNGRWARLIPSLDGSLYRFDGTSFEALPISADTLLSKSFMMPENIITTGGKEIRVYGVDYQSGKLRYTCNMEGCKFYENGVLNKDDILVIRRYTQTVRAVDQRTGIEKWNYSVGQHELLFIQNVPDMTCDDNDEENTDVIQESWEDSSFNVEDLKIKVVVQQGIVSAVDKYSNNNIWQFKFDSPLVDVWSLSDKNLIKLDLFHDEHIDKINRNDGSFVMPQALFYLGIHNKQSYIQQSHSMVDKVNKAIHAFNTQGITTFPRIQWKPYIVTALSRTPIIIGHPQKNSLIFNRIKRKTDMNTALVRYESDYPFDTCLNLASYLLDAKDGDEGFYILPSETVLNKDEFNYFNETVLPDDEYIIKSLWYWWREVLAICIASTVLVNVVITRYIMKRMKRKMAADKEQIISPLNQSSGSSGNSETVIEAETKKADDEILNKSQPENYTSRYLTDFEPVQCLGKGGFGVVFQAKNKIDDCDYAIKRISLPDRDDALKKVMREVKALAKLDHVGIVRYYNAWLERPPPGWQEDMDKQWEAKGLLSSAPFFSSEDSTDLPKAKPKKILNPLHPFDQNSLEDNVFNQPNKHSESLGFIVVAKDQESGAFSFEKNSHIPFVEQIQHPDSKSQESLTTTQSGKNVIQLPFQNYCAKHDTSGNSFSIVFEDSGCAERGNIPEKSKLSNNNLSKEKNRINNAKRQCVENSEKPETRPKSLEVKSSKKQSVNSPNIPRLYLYIQMQLCQKENLKDWLHENLAREPMQILDIFYQIVSAVEYVHEQGLMHRDLKPSNIFFSMDGTIKVGDFGLVTEVISGCEDHTPCESGPFKKHTEQVGTQLYMSPEQISGQMYSHKVDIYSLGLIFFELLLPFKTQMERLNVMSNIKKHQFPEEFLKQQPEESKFVQQMLDKNPDDRPSAVEIKSHSLLNMFQPRPEILRHRSRTRTFSRTYSSSSSGSGSLDN